MALAALGGADHVRLARIARLRARGLPEVDWQDLLHDAIARALDGSRRWPSDVPLLVYLAGTMRSLASEAWRRRIARPVARESDEDHGPGLIDEGPDPERALTARDLLRKTLDLFADDHAALAVISGLAEGQTPAEVQAEATLSPTEYDSARRRIRRTLARAHPEMP